MIETILNELKTKFRTLKEEVLSNAISEAEANRQADKLIFSANIVQSSLNKNPDAFTEEKIRKIRLLKADVEEFKNMFPIIFIDGEVDENIVEELKLHLPETIHTDDDRLFETRKMAKEIEDQFKELKQEFDSNEIDLYRAKDYAVLYYTSIETILERPYLTEDDVIKFNALKNEIEEFGENIVNEIKNSELQA